MFTIDLLNGQGRPQKTKPGGVVIVALTAVLPVLLGLGTFGLYLHNKVTISLKDREIERNEARIEKFSDALEFRDALMKEKTTYGDCLSEVGSIIKHYSQWSPILTTVVENMPETVVLTLLEVERKTTKIKVFDEDDPKEKKEIEVPYRILRLSVSGGPQQNCDEAVRHFQERLRTSDLLGPRLEKINVSRNSRRIKKQDIFTYEITCTFKPRL